MDKKLRISNFELLRIISVIFIITSHFSIHGGFNLTEEYFTMNKLIIQILGSAGKFGVNLF